jgi:NAD(P)-dependent dehydrogenase (short-subunit alcohol dehydrogenase family)
VERIGRPEDVAKACLNLSEHAGFITGQDVVVDGGMSVRMAYAR